MNLVRICMHDNDANDFNLKKISFQILETSKEINTIKPYEIKYVNMDGFVELCFKGRILENPVCVQADTSAMPRICLK